jgi:hypothetical protein
MVKRSAIAALGLLLVAGSAHAQPKDVQDALTLLLFGSGAQPGLATQNAAVFIAVPAMVTLQTTTMPSGSSAGGFTWTLDPSLGIETRRTSSFGPIFAERAYTNGRGKINVALSFQHSSVDSIAGQPLSNLRDTFAMTIDGVRYEDISSTSMKLTTDSTLLAATVGVTDRIDVGVVIPFVRTAISGTVAEQFTANGHVVPDLSTSSHAEGASSGVGDVVLRAKTNVIARPALGVAAEVNLRLPTGNKDQLLGVGNAQTRVMAIAASSFRMVSPHVNLGYTFGGRGFGVMPDGGLDFSDAHPSDEINYAFGADVAASPTITLAGDVIGRTLRHSARIEYASDSFGQFFSASPGNVTSLLGAVGAKVNVRGMWLITGSVLFPLSSSGTRPGVTPVIGFERAF